MSKIIFFPFVGSPGDKLFELNSERWHAPFVMLRDKLIAQGHTVQAFPCPVEKESAIGIYFDSPEYPAPLTKRSIAILFEPPCVKPRQYERIKGLPFSKVLTHFKEAVDNSKIFYCPYPLVKPSVIYPAGPREKMCVAVYSNKHFDGPGQLYDARRQQILSWGKDLDLYGPGWSNDPEVMETVNYMGPFMGPKIEIMKQYKYAVAYDNCISEGYCSEKLPDAINAGCIPIHRGWIPDYPFEQAYESPWSDYVVAHIKEIL